MGVSILEDKNGYKAMYCNTTMWAFGGIFYDGEDVWEFIDWLHSDPRSLSDVELETEIYKWRRIKTITE